VIDYDKTDPNFFDDLCASDLCTRTITAWLKKKGYPAIATEMQYRPHFQQMAEFADRGDIRFYGIRVEAKHRKTLSFTSIETFPYSTIIVDAAHCWYNADPKPIAYFLANKELTCCLLVRSKTFKYWVKTRRFDRPKNRERDFLECPTEHCEFRLLDVTKEEVEAIPSTIPEELRRRIKNPRRPLA
jgi:hypothetical protein